MRTLLILGAGGHAKVLLEAAEQMGQWRDFAFLDDRVAGNIHGYPIVGTLQAAAMLRERFNEAIVGIGNNQLRLFWQKFLLDNGYDLPNVIHPSAVISSSAILGNGCAVFAQAVVNADACIGDSVILNTACSVDHDCVIGAGVHVAPGSRLAGGVYVEQEAWIGLSSCVNVGVKIGRHAVVGAGAVVIKNVKEETTVAGVPAHPIKP
ncbi:acetyltransferase [Anaeroarcus burkinensis]|uniref:acetyltransferase n=1 Tax=Anaeroarcus burkinensis TaxID=82376 RepID=UPI000482C9D9|nr:acetyltransferase [Anaeroarcus burkinensis]